MSHLVIYTSTDGTVGYEPCSQLTDAVRHVEQMRNERGIEVARIYTLEEVKFEIKPYYRVELAGATRSGTEWGSDLPSRGAPSPVDAPPSAVSSVTAEVASLIAPPPPPANPISPSAVDDALSELENAEANVGSRRGLFGR